MIVDVLPISLKRLIPEEIHLSLPSFILDVLFYAKSLGCKCLLHNVHENEGVQEKSVEIV